jgi:histidinol phosphatase-like enzyme (inositol monophosphatase family)
MTASSPSTEPSADLSDSAILPDGVTDLAARLADAAGSVIRRYYRTPFAVDDKPDSSPVTIADREAEAAIRAILAAERPDDGIVGEEHGTTNGDADWLWVIDPIDGTKSFITGRPTFGTLVALLYRGRPVLGVIDQPITGDRWVGAVGQPTTLNGKPAHVRACPSLGRATLNTTSPDLFGADDYAAFRRVATAVKLPMYGGDCYAYGLLAAGFVDLVIEAGLKLYDYAALVPVVEGAGGVMTDWSGAPLGRGSDGRVVAAGDAAAHAEALARLGEAPLG